MATNPFLALVLTTFGASSVILKGLIAFYTIFHAPKLRPINTLVIVDQV